MAASKQYCAADQYEKKLEKVREQLNANELNYTLTITAAGAGAFQIRFSYARLHCI